MRIEDNKKKKDRQKMKNKKKMKKKSKIELGKTNLELRAIANTALNIALSSRVISILSDTLGASFALEDKRRLDEFKLMNVIEIEFQDKNKKEIEYRELSSIDKFKKKFLKENPKWVCQEKTHAEIKTGKLIFTRVYRKYNKKELEEDEYEDRCPHCGEWL